MNFSDFDVAYLRKTMNRLWVLMQPQGSSSADIGFVTNRAESQSKKHIEYKIQVMDDVDFANFSFQISTNPQPFRLKMKAKKFTNLKIIIDNTEKTDCTILQLVLKVESFGESKQEVQREKNFEVEVLERLAKIESKIDDYKTFKEKTDTAYNTAKQNKDEIDEIKNKLQWVSRTIAGTIIGIVIAAIVFVIKMMQEVLYE